jgi:hypothetical protein
MSAHLEGLASLMNIRAMAEAEVAGNVPTGTTNRGAELPSGAQALLAVQVSRLRWRAERQHVETVGHVDAAAGDSDGSE